MNLLLVIVWSSAGSKQLIPVLVLARWWSGDQPKYHTTLIFTSPIAKCQIQKNNQFSIN
jgi:hypothetical protein